MYKLAPDEAFPTPTFQEVMDKFLDWDLPESVCCIIRVTNTKNRKVKEYVYQKQHAADNRIKTLLDASGIELLVMEHSDVHYIREYGGEDVDYSGNYGLDES